MGADTTIMEWKQRLQDLREEPTREKFESLKEHEEYMVAKGYQIHFTKIISPNGEQLWERN